ncbi:glycerate kinase [bacterium]|nr:glycerate kinase [bacterium]
MKIVLAPDSFKGTFSAGLVCRAWQKAAERVCPGAEVLCCPLADGGEGTLEVLFEAVGGRRLSFAACDPLERPLQAELGLLEGGEALIEMARTSGLDLLAPSERNPWVAGTRGLGLAVLAALDAGATSLCLTLGGSATVDGGVGMARVLGFRFLDRHGHVLEYEGGRILGKIARIDRSGADPRLAGLPVRALCDVTNPLTGPLGAARVFGPQKGAAPAMIERLELGLERLARRFERDLGHKVAAAPGAGAAGGMGAAVLAFLGGKLIRGIDYVLETTGFDSALAGADIVLTGEGSFDSQSLGGKVLSGVFSRAEAAGVPVDVVCGRVADLDESGRPAGAGARRIWSGADLDIPARRMLNAADLTRLAEMSLQDFLSPSEGADEH